MEGLEGAAADFNASAGADAGSGDADTLPPPEARHVGFFHVDLGDAPREVMEEQLAWCGMADVWISPTVLVFKRVTTTTSGEETVASIDAPVVVERLDRPTPDQVLEAVRAHIASSSK